MVPLNALASTLEQIIKEGHTPAYTLNQVVQIVGLTLQVDRCFLYVRQPDQRRGRTAFCWRKHEAIPDKNTIQLHWQADTEELAVEDPLIRAALAMKPSVYIDDVETASPQVLNQQFERETFGHRALIHGHIQYQDQLWGILQPSVFDRSRYWTNAEKEQFSAILPLIQPVIAAFVSSIDT